VVRIFAVLATASCLMGMAVVFVMNLGWVTQTNGLRPAQLLSTLGSSLFGVLGVRLIANTLVVLRSRPVFADREQPPEAQLGSRDRRADADAG
jgi:hypothetical protein